MGRVGKRLALWGAWVTAAVAVAVIAYFVLGTGWPNPYQPPIGGETFEPTGKLYEPRHLEAPVDQSSFIRELSDRETAAFRHFIEHADYQELESYKDQVNMPVVRIDGINWFVYRGGLFRVDGGDSGHRKAIDEVNLSTPGPGHEINFEALLAWYEGEE